MDVTSQKNEARVLKDPLSSTKSNKPQVRTILVKPHYWKYEDVQINDEGAENLIIHIGGRDEKNQSVHVIVEGFTPFVYLKLPSRIKWNKAKHEAIFEYFKKIMKSNGPLKMFHCKKRFPKYLEEFDFLCFTFPTQGACRSFAYKCNPRNGLFIEGLGMFKNGELSVHEHNIDPIIKFTAVRQLPLANWIQVEEVIHAEDKGLSIEERKYSTANVDLYTTWDKLVEHKSKELIVVNNKYMCFDIECHSKNHNSKLPDPSYPENKVFQIGFTVGYCGKPEVTTTLFSLGNPKDIKGVKVVRFKTEKELLMGFRNFMVKTDPDMIKGFNTIKFDWMYLLKRAELLGIYDKFIQLTRCIGRKSHEIKTEWQSSAYGEQSFKYLDPLGRTNIDVLLDIERNYKLPAYSLKSVGEFFKLDKEEQKEDVSARQLFMTVDLTDKLTPEFAKLPDSVVSKKERIRLKKIVQAMLPMRMCTGKIKEWRAALMDAKTGTEFKDIIRDGLTITGTYCARDTVVPVALCNKLNLVIAMEEISNCMYVPMSYIHTRGQQIKVIAQIYRKTVFANIVIPYNKKEDSEGYQGATVIEANPGDYDNVVCYDFESLYPTTMIALNICYTTLLKPNDPTPDSECNPVPISEHVGCPHDPQKRKKKKDEILCKECVYRFKKVKFNPDGTRENEGILPAIERDLLLGRKATKKEMAKQEAILKMVTGLATPDDIQYYTKMGWKIYKKGDLDGKQIDVLKIGISVLNAQQLAKKVSANSVYGALGATAGYLPLIEGASSVTATGRALIMKCIKYILETNPGDENGLFKALLVYGDSVTPDTPVLIRRKDKKGKSYHVYVNIEDIPRKTKWTTKGEKGVATPADDVEIWSDKGFTKVKKIIRHKTDKDIYRILTHTGCVDVTSDHSLLLPDGKEVRPIDVKLKDELLHAELPPSISWELEQSPAQGCPYSMGLFYGDGSCGYYLYEYGNKGSWAINNINLDYLNKAKKELEAFYPFTFNILDTMESSAVYKLVPNGCGVTDFVKEWRSYFYTSRKQKKVPETILNASKEVMEQFLQGYYDADGDQEYYRFDNKGGIGAAGLLYIVTQLGCKTSVNFRMDKPDIYRVTATTKKQRRPANKIKKIWNMGPSNDYVYDIETNNHHFAAGVGKLVVHNTDSSMLTFNGASTEASFELGDRISKQVSHFLKTHLCGMDENYEIECLSEKRRYRIDKYPRDKIKELSDKLKVDIYKYDYNPINLQFENLYKRYLLFTKKRYVAYAVNRKGEITNKIKKGVVLVRRDNCQYLKDTYDKMIVGALDKKPEEYVMGVLYSRVHDLFTRQIPDANLIIYMGVKTLINYAKKKKGTTEFVDEDGKTFDPNGPADPRLLYPNIPQVLLARKMIARGDDVPPNTRLEFLYVENEEADHQGEKAEDYTFYRENKASLKLRPDYLHYIEKQLTNPITELLTVKYPRPIVPYEKIADAVERCISETEFIIQSTVNQIKKYSRTIGGNSKKNAGRTYNYKGVAAKVQYILDAAERWKTDRKAKPNEVINGARYTEVIKVCKRWKAFNIINTIHAYYGTTKRVQRRPTQSGEKLRVTVANQPTEAVLIKEVVTTLTPSEGGKRKVYKSGVVIKLLEVREENVDTALKKKKYLYKIRMPDQVEITDVERSKFTTFYHKDSNIMKDILMARGAYKAVVNQLNIFFDPFLRETKKVKEYKIEDMVDDDSI